MEPDKKKELLIKTEPETDPRFGCIPEMRKLPEYLKFGVVNIDKPPGPSSHQVSSYVKEILHLNKTGHAGTLDPRVTGCLPVELENSVKTVRTLLSYGKEYVCVMKLQSTAAKKRVKKLLKYFCGEIYQKPPLKSAVKRQLRTRNIYYIKFLEKDENYVLFRVGCAAGTYIRKLCHDVGLILGTGANMQELRRTKAGPFDESSLVTLHDLKDAYIFYEEDGDEKYLRKLIHPVEFGVRHLKKIWVNDSTISALCHGANLYAPGVVKLQTGIERDDLIAIFSLKDELVALGRTLNNSDAIYDSQKGAVVELNRVIMDKDVYPRVWKKKEN